MKMSDKKPSTFEEQLTQSARRLRDEQNYQLPLRPLHRSRFSWGWVSTGAAAVIGWLVGICFPIDNSFPEKNMAALTQTDTVVQYKERVVRDTIVKEVKVPVKVKVPVVKSEVPAQRNAGGCNVECDGIDYAMLIRM